jgi:hypothetical protein
MANGHMVGGNPMPKAGSVEHQVVLIGVVLVANYNLPFNNY